jgi:LPS-assembly protein
MKGGKGGGTGTPSIGELWRAVTATVALGVVLVVILAVPAGAQPAPPANSAPATKTGKDASYVLLRADEATYDRNTGVVTARGNVEIAHGELVLRADTIIYDEKNDKVTATGNVVLLEPTGEVKFSERAEFTNAMKDGVAEGFRMLLADDSRLAAIRGTRTGGVVTTLDKAVFSPCDLCTEDPTRAPLWQVRAVRVTHDSERKEIEYRDAYMDFYGIPVFYTPYFSHPDPSVKRRSGILTPSYGSDSDFGYVLKVPYFWEISPSEDVTITPHLMTDQASVLAANYRRRFTNAEVEVDVSGTTPEREDSLGNPVGGTDFRGHLFAKGTVHHSPIWRSSFQIQNASDDTYLRRYKFPEPERQTLVSKFNTEGFMGRNYAQLSGYSFQGLRETDDPGSSPLVLPFAEYNFVSDPAANGSYMTADASLLAITRDQGTDSRRMAFNGGWHLPYTASTGEIYTLSASLRTDLYSVNDVTTAPGTTESGFAGRVMPQLMAQWRYPFVRGDAIGSQLVEPVAAVVVAPNGGNPDKIPNEDSLDVEFDDTNLFDSSRFTGVDRFESGTRFIYGLNWGYYGNNGGVVEAFAGQSHRLRAEPGFSESSGLRDKTSDIVGRLRLSPGDWLDLIYRTRFDPEEEAARRHQLALSAGPSRFKVGVNYLFLDETSTTSEFTDREELILSFSAQLTKYWGASGYIHQDLAPNGGTISEGLGLVYTDECFTFRVQGLRTFTSDRDLKPTDSLMFILTFKHLGEIASGG